MAAARMIVDSSRRHRPRVPAPLEERQDFLGAAHDDLSQSRDLPGLCRPPRVAYLVSRDSKLARQRK